MEVKTSIRPSNKGDDLLLEFRWRTENGHMGIYQALRLKRQRTHSADDGAHPLESPSII